MTGRAHEFRRLRVVAAVALGVAAVGCFDPPLPSAPDDDPAPSTPRFVSADPTGGIAAPYDPFPPTGPDNGGYEPYAGGATLALDSGLRAVVTPFRGIDLVDDADPNAPRVVSTIPFAGSNASLYARGATLFALTSSRFAAVESAPSSVVTAEMGGALAVFDLSDPAAPALIERTELPGAAIAIKVATVDSAAILHLVASGESEGLDSFMTFDVSGGALVPVDEVELPGRATAVRLTDAVTMIACVDEAFGHSVTLVDTTDPTGALAERGAAEVAGEVERSLAMDLFRDVLRVVSRVEPWGYEIETFSAAQTDVLAPLDSFPFAGPEEQLDVSVFLGNRAFFVTRWVEDPVDPLHAFEIGDDGAIVERLELIEPGWTSRLVPVLGDTRLVGIGRSSAFSDGAPAVRLYDITDLSNPNPLIAEAEVQVLDSNAAHMWGGGSLVLEDAVSVSAPSGDVMETGLVLLSFEGYDEGTRRIVYGTQLFTFSSTTVTRRGLLEHGTPVRGSFPVAGGLFATLSDAALSLWDVTNLAAPVARGRLVLSENSVDWLPLPDGSSARINHRADYDSTYWYDGAPQRPSAIEVLAPGADPNDAAIATIDFDGEAVVFATGSTLVAIDGPWPPPSYPPERFRSHVAVFDLSDPTAPVLARTIDTELLPFVRAPAPESWWCSQCVRIPYMPSSEVLTLPGALVFVSRPDASASTDQVEYCRLWPERAEECNIQGVCRYYAGEVNCVRPLDVDEPTCRGTLTYCVVSPDNAECDEVDPDEVELNRDCREGRHLREWQRMSLTILDVRDPANATLVGPIDLPDDASAGAVVVDGSTVWASLARIVDVPDDTRAWRSWLAVPIDLRDPASPVMGEAIEVPGELLEVAGTLALTRDWHFAGTALEGSINRVALDVTEREATLEQSERFAGRELRSVMLDGAGHVLVDDRSLDWQIEPLPHITVLDAALERRATFGLDRRAVLRASVAGRVLEQLDETLMVILNLDDPAAPYAQAWFPVRDWPASARALGDDIVIPAGRFGIYRFDRDFENLPTPAP